MKVYVERILSRSRSQALFGKYEVLAIVTIENAELVAKFTNGNVYWDKLGAKESLPLDYRGRYFKVKIVLEEAIWDAIYRKIDEFVREGGKARKIGRKRFSVNMHTREYVECDLYAIDITVDLEKDIDWDKVRSAMVEVVSDSL